MKIGILTYTREYANLGTNMQCYCTLRAVQAAYPDARVELIDYATARPLPLPYLSHASLPSVALDFRRIRKYSRFFRKELTFSPAALITRDLQRALDFIRRQEYAGIYVGSDTVLELKHAGPDQLTPFWLAGTLPGTAMLAAASCHNLTKESLSSRQASLMEKALASFALLSVRDDATFRLISSFVGPSDKRLQIIPDPTFTYDIDYSHIERYLDRRRIPLDKPLVCLHLLRNSAWAPGLAAHFRKTGYRVASLRPARYADILFTDLSPFEQMGLYKYFSLVVTHRFHDTIFSLKNLTPVVAFPEHGRDVTSHGESKIATLLKSFGADRSCYLPNTEALNATKVADCSMAAVAHFQENRGHIAGILAAHKQRYQIFVQSSRLLVN